VEQEGSVSDDAPGIASGVGRCGHLELLDEQTAVRGVAEKPAQGVIAAGVAGLKRIAVAGDDGRRGVDVAFTGLRTVQVMAEVGGDDGDRAGRGEQGGQDSGDGRGRRVADDDGSDEARLGLSS
jgi:hypothetical protein